MRGDGEMAVEPAYEIPVKAPKRTPRAGLSPYAPSSSAPEMTSSSPG